MPKIIIDQFTSQDITAQRRYQLRREREACCKQCGGVTATEDKLCPLCREAHNRRMRDRRNPIMSLI